MSKTDKRIAAHLDRVERLLDNVDLVLERLTRAVEHAEALRAAQDASITHSTVPTEKPRTGALNALHEALADCPGLSPQEMQELHPECFEDDERKLRERADAILDREWDTALESPALSRPPGQATHIGWTNTGYNNLILESPSDQNNTLLTGSKQGIPQDVIGYMIRDEHTGRWYYKHVSGQHPTMTQIDAMTAQLEQAQTRTKTGTGE